MENLNRKNGKAAFASAITPAWHGTGQIKVDGAMTYTEAITMAMLDYPVVKQPVYVKMGTSEILVPEKYATVRGDNNTALGVVGSRYHILQNSEAFDWFDNIVGAGDAYFETAGALGNGETIFITAKMPSHISVGKDVVEQYLLLTNNHSGQSSIVMAFTPIRVVCQNTLNAALKCCSNKVVVRHTSGATQKMKEAARAMGIANLYFQEMEEVLNAMASTKITDIQLRDFIRKAVAPRSEVGGKGDAAKSHKTTENILEEVYVYATNHETQRGQERTLYGAYNAISGYYHNVKQWEDGDSRMKSIVGGRVYKATQRAFDLALNFVNN